MSANEQVAGAFLSAHPAAAARLLESMDADQASTVIQSVSPGIAARVLGQMLPTSSAQCAERLAAQVVADMLEHLPSLSGAILLRHFRRDARNEVLNRLKPSRMAALKLLLRYPLRAVGAWMEPRVLTFPDDCSVREANERLERAGIPLPRIYVLDRDRRLRGAVRPPELLRGGGRNSIVTVLEPSESIWARESIASAQERDVWEKESEAPVVNRQNEFVGAVAYADIRRGHRQLIRTESGDMENRAVGELAELFLHGFEDAWQSLGELVGTTSQDNSGKNP
jgi:Mg/Co/Ni transporter MgtE